MGDVPNSWEWFIIPSERIKFKVYLEFSNAVVEPWGIIKS